MQRRTTAVAGLDAAGLRAAIVESFVKLSPRHAVRSPIMAIVLLGTVLSALITIFVPGNTGFGIAVSVILLITVLFANFAEAVAEARGRGQAASLRAARRDLVARKLDTIGKNETRVAASTLKPGDRVIVSANELIPA
ncbi:potassium-transporting ATPase subunit B, partial [Lysobacter sp. 2RAB21]